MSGASTPSALRFLTHDVVKKTPLCSGMRPCTVVPEEYHRQRMTFVCECGFDYCQSSAAAIERTL
jgi:hypothetical protein